ncbi:MAG: pyridoxamine 5'-phosphate oxidase family protein [Chloroflexota bacterium]
MNADDPAVLNFIQRAMVARIATLSHNGRPSITPLYFVTMKGHIWLGTADWTLAAREAKADPRVSVLFQIEQNPNDHRILRIMGSATVQTDTKTMRSSNLRMALKYILTPGSIRNRLSNRRLIQFERLYHMQSAEKGMACVIDVTLEQAEFLTDN